MECSFNPPAILSRKRLELPVVKPIQTSAVADKQLCRFYNVTLMATLLGNLLRLAKEKSQAFFTADCAIHWKSCKNIMQEWSTPDKD
jgi:hypothetical protein